MKKIRLFGGLGALLVSIALTASEPTLVSAATLPVQYVLDGTFTTVSGSTAPGPFDGRNFNITWSVPDPTAPDDPFGATYLVNASLTIEGIGSFQQGVAWQLSPYTYAVGLVSFQGILTPDDNIAFGICSGGACSDPILWNQDPLNPELFTGVFALGSDSSCAFSAPCLNAIANYFFPNESGGFDAITTLYVGTLYATTVPISPTIWLFGSGIFGLASFGNRKKTEQNGSDVISTSLGPLLSAP